MDSQVQIDERDIKILRELIRDSRTKVKDIARICGLSSAAILHRIENLKTKGVIVGAVQFLDMSHMGFMYAASIGLGARTKSQDKEAILKIMRSKSNVLISNESAGNNTFRAFVVAKSLEDLEDLKQSLRKQMGYRKVTLNIWSTPQFLFNNLELEPSGRKGYG